MEWPRDASLRKHLEMAAWGGEDARRRSETVEGSVWKRKINLFLLGIPVVLFADRLGIANDYLTLALLAGLALIPLAGFVESAVEELAELLGPFAGGLLHTTFGNVAELFIALSVLLTFPIGRGAEVVLGSIAGVIIRNSLLFLGLGTFLGSLKNGRMQFNAERAGQYTTVFALAIIGLSLPTLAHFIKAGSGVESTCPGSGAHEELLLFCQVPLSVALAVVLLVSYLAYVLFAVFRFRAGDNLDRRHPRSAFDPAIVLAERPDTQALFEQEREQAEERVEELDEYLHPKMARAKALRQARRAEGEEGASERFKGARGLLALVILAVAIAGVFLMSETFAGGAERLIATNKVLEDYEFFFGLIVIPVVGGLVELYGTAGSARANRMELVMATTAGATIQMILLMVPVLVLVGAVMNRPLDLIFKPIEIIIFGAATFVFMLLSRDGESSILEGVQLVALWTLLAVTALFLPPA
jgi:Ca2+:H+ antiporter